MENGSPWPEGGELFRLQLRFWVYFHRRVSTDLCVKWEKSPFLINKGRRLVKNRQEGSKLIKLGANSQSTQLPWEHQQTPGPGPGHAPPHSMAYSHTRGFPSLLFSVCLPKQCRIFIEKLQTAETKKTHAHHPTVTSVPSKARSPSS